MYSQREDWQSARGLAEAYYFLMDAELFKSFPNDVALLRKADASCGHTDAGLLNLLLEVDPAYVLEVFRSPESDLGLFAKLNVSHIPEHALQGESLIEQYARKLCGYPTDYKACQRLASDFLAQLTGLNLETLEVALDYQRIYLKRIYGACAVLAQLAPQTELQNAANYLLVKLHVRSPLKLAESLKTQMHSLRVHEILIQLDQTASEELKIDIFERLEQAEIRGDYVARWLAERWAFGTLMRQRFSPHCKRLAALREAQFLVDRGLSFEAIELLQAHKAYLGPWAERQCRLIARAVYGSY